MISEKIRYRHILPVSWISEVETDARLKLKDALIIRSRLLDTGGIFLLCLSELNLESKNRWNNLFFLPVALVFTHKALLLLSALI